MKRYILGVVAVAVVWQVMDFVIHSVILMSTYEATAELWRSMEEMKAGLMMVVTLLGAVAFVGLYAKFCGAKSLKAGALFGLIWGLGAGVSMGYGTYSYMPIPYVLALSWFLATTVKGVAAGALAGLIVKGADGS